MHRTSQSHAILAVLGWYVAAAAWLSFEPGVRHVLELSNRLLIAFLLPTTAAVLLWLFHTLESKRPLGVREPGDGAAAARVLFHCIVFIGSMHGLVLLLLTETPVVAAIGPQLPVILIGVLLVSVGNLLPTTRPNIVVGIRTARSLRSRHFWMEINRVGGYVSVAVGLVMIGAAVALRFPMVVQVTGIAVVAAVGVLGVRYRSLVRAERA